MKYLVREKAFATLNGSRYVRYSAGNVDAALLVHETAIEELRAIDAAIADAKAPAAVWQIIYRSGTVLTCRMQVPGGWIVKHTTKDIASMAFVPDAKHTWRTRIEGEA